LKRVELHFASLSLDNIVTLARDEVAYRFLIAAAGLNRTSLKKATEHEEARIVAPRSAMPFAQCRVCDTKADCSHPRT
jgi:hypothetical protein